MSAIDTLLRLFVSVDLVNIRSTIFGRRNFGREFHRTASGGACIPNKRTQGTPRCFAECLPRQTALFKILHRAFRFCLVPMTSRHNLSRIPHAQLQYAIKSAKRVALPGGIQTTSENDGKVSGSYFAKAPPHASRRCSAASKLLRPQLERRRAERRPKRALEGPHQVPVGVLDILHTKNFRITELMKSNCLRQSAGISCQGADAASPECVAEWRSAPTACLCERAQAWGQ